MSKNLENYTLIEEHAQPYRNSKYLQQKDFQNLLGLYMLFNRRVILLNWFPKFFLFLHFLISTKSKLSEYLKRNKMSSDKNLPI